MAPPQRTQWLGARATAGAMALTIALVATFVVFLSLREPMRQWMALHLALVPRRALGPEPWQLVTSGFLCIGLANLLWSGLGVWLFGTAVEQQTSRARMFLTFFAAQIVGMLAVAAVGRLFAPDGVPEPLVKGMAGFSGAAPGVTGLLAAFGVLYGPVPMRFFGLVEMRGRTMALVLLGFGALTLLLNQDWVMLAGEAAGAAAGWAVASRVGDRFSTAWDRFRLWRLRRRYKVIPGGRDGKRYLN